MPFPNRRNFEGALAALDIDRSGRGLPLLEGIQIVYTNDIGHLVEPVGVPRRWSTYIDLATAVGRYSVIEFAPPVDAAIVLEYLHTDAVTASCLNVGPPIISGGRTVLITGFYTGLQGGLASRQVVSSGDIAIGEMPQLLMLTADTVYCRGGNSLVPVTCQPGEVINIILWGDNLGQQLDAVVREFPPRIG